VTGEHGLLFAGTTLFSAPVALFVGVKVGVANFFFGSIDRY